MEAKKDKLTLCFILKDEAETIKDVIEAFWLDGKPLYDQLIIGIDKSTKDDTHEIVKPYTKDISFFQWNDDFATPRNELIEKVPKNSICVFPDGHEVMRPHGKYVLEEFLRQTPTVANVFSPWFEIDVDKYDIPEVLFKRAIIFRNTGSVEWKKTTHNYLYDSEKQIIMSIPQMSFVHNMPEERKEMRRGMRKTMNKQRLEESLNKNPEDVRDSFYYADVTEERGEFDKAVKYYSDLFDKTNKKDPDMAAQTCVSTMNALCRAGRYEEMVEWGHKGLNNRWDRAELFYYLGMSAYNLEKYEEAIHWYECALPGGKAMVIPETSYFLLAKVYSWYPWDGLMAAKKKIGDYEGAIKAIDKILYFQTDKKTGEPHPVYDNNKKALQHALEEEKNQISNQWINKSGMVEDLKKQINFKDMIPKNKSNKINIDNTNMEVV